MHHQPGMNTFTGQSLLRREDRRFLTGRSTFTADIQLAGQLHAAFLRSPHAHARINGVETAAASGVKGVVAVYTARDLEGQVDRLPGSIVTMLPKWKNTVESEDFTPTFPVLAGEEVTHVGQAVAVVVATSRAAAEDGVDVIAVDWEPLPAVVDPWEALKPGAPQASSASPGNVLLRLKVAKGDAAGALAAAPHRLREPFHHHRYTAVSMEGRAIVCDWDERRGVLKAWIAGQSAHNRRRALAEGLRLPLEQVEVQIPDVGGGFGPKFFPYCEDLVVGFAARRLGRPVKWVEDRRENLQATYHSRDHQHDLEVGFDNDGRLLALRTNAVIDNGAYNPMGFVEPANAATHMLGPYKVDHYEFRITAVCTNKTAHVPYRGAGRPESCFPMERMLDRIALHLNLDPAEVRRRNMIPVSLMPYHQGLTYRDGQPIVYDCGDFHDCLDQALAAAGYDEIRRSQPDWWQNGKYVGVGIGFYVEGTGVGPFEGARVRIDSSGRVVVIAGHASHGQGHETVLAQIAADVWGTTPDEILVIGGDTVRLPHGAGSYASRTVVVAGTAIHQASLRLQRKMRELSAHMLEASPEDLEVSQGRVHIKGAPARSLSFRELAQAAAPGPASRRPTGMEPDLEVSHYFEPSTVTWSYAAQVAVVEVDVETAVVTVKRMVVAHDAGRIVNPLLADGQVMGGVVQGIGGALYEELVYDENGQLLTGSLMDYLMPTAMEAPPIDVIHIETPSTLNPLGVKGLGEGGAIASPAAVVGAVEDALRPLGVRLNRTPLSPKRLFEEIRQARERGLSE